MPREYGWIVKGYVAWSLKCVLWAENAKNNLRGLVGWEETDSVRFFGPGSSVQILDSGRRSIPSLRRIQ
jgi:hypothetical protein